MLVEFHILQNHSPSNLNRDDTGSPKDCVFGGVPRARISSQCLKRTMRRSSVFADSIGATLGVRTKRLPEEVRRRLMSEGVASDWAAVAAELASGFGTKKGKVQKPAADGTFATAQLMFLAETDIESVTAVLRAAIARCNDTLADFKKVKSANLQGDPSLKVFRPISVDVALFGRMTTSEALRDVEAAVQVAHAISTHRVEQEYDYFTAVDDLKQLAALAGDDDMSAGMIGDVEFNSACYYKYVAVDVEAIVDNLTGRRHRTDVTTTEVDEARAMALRALEALARSLALVSPSGKQNTFAAHQLPALVLVEIRPVRTPVSYANAFARPVSVRGDTSLVEESAARLAAHVDALTTGFNLPSVARFALAPELGDARFVPTSVSRVVSLNALCESLKAVVSGGSIGDA